MRTVHGDIWQYHTRGAWVVVTTNLQCRKDGTAVMGAGIAREAASRFPGLAAQYGRYLREDDPDNTGCPSHPYLVEQHRLVLFPTKDDWRKPSDLRLIQVNLVAFRMIWDGWNSDHARPLAAGPSVAFPPLGCGHGKLDWVAQVEPLMSRYLNHPKFAVVLR